MTQSVSAGNKIWSASSGTDTNWSTAGNWNPAGVPGAADDALFFDSGSTNDNVSITSVIDSNRTIHALRLGQTNLETHNLLISPGVTLTVAGTNDNGYGPRGIDPAAPSNTNGLSTLFAGPWPGPSPLSGAVNLTNTISGLGGTLVLNNTNNEMMVRYADGNNQAHYAVLDMSGLGTFVANLGRIGVGYGQPGGTVRAMGRLLLAQTNIITLSGTNFADTMQLIVGSNQGNNDGNSTTAFIHLGQTNRFNLDKMIAGGQKTPGQILFNTSLNNPSFYMRGSDGVGRVSAIRLGDESDSGATSGPSTGTVNLLAGTSDIMADTIILGKSQNANGSSAATGNLLMGSGKLDVNTLIMGAQANSSYGGTVTGNATFSNTTVIVNTSLQMGVSVGSASPRVANLNITGGSMTVNGTYKNQGTVNINVTNATLTMPTGSAITANNIQLDGGTIANAGTLKATNTLNIVNAGSIAGSPVLDLGNNNLAPANWNVEAVASGSLTVNNALQGSGNISGNIIQAAGATLSPGGLNAAGTLSILGNGGNLTLNDGGTLNFDLATASGAVNDLINAGGTVTVNGNVNVFLRSLGGSLDTTTPYTLITGASVVGNQTQFKAVGPLTTGRYTFAFDTSVANTVRLIVGGTGPASQTWVGDGTANIWDAQGAFNWNNGASSQFFNLDNVTFNDSGSAAPPVNITGSLVAGSISVNNTNKNYSFGGAGSLTIAGPVAKFGPGSLTLANLSDNIFSSVMTVSNGAVTLSNNGQNTFLGGVGIYGGSVTLGGNSTNVFSDTGFGAPVVTIGAGTSLTLADATNVFNGLQVELDGSLTFNQTADTFFDGSLIGSGPLTKNGANKLTLSGNNSSYSGPIQINAGTIIAGNGAGPLGTLSATITNSAALDVNGKNLGTLAITVSGAGPTGAGALVNNGGPQNSSLTSVGTALQSVTMAGDTTIGGAGPFNTDTIQNVGYFAITGTFSTGGSNYNLTKVGLNQISLINATVDAALGNIDVQQGMLTFQGSTTSMGNPGSNVTVRAGGILAFYDTTTLWDKNFILFGDGATPNIWNYNGSHTIIGAVTLNGNCVFGGAPLGRGSPVSMAFNGPISGPGALVKSIDTNTVVLNGTNNYVGTTTVNGGGLLIDGIGGTNSTTVNNGIFGGLGFVRGAVTVQSGGTLSPGDLANASGTLSISNNLTLAGATAMDVAKAGTAFTSDEITNVTSLTFGGTLRLALTGDALAVGDAIKLFSFGSASGSFAAFDPATPGDGLAWDTSTLRTDGNIRVSVAPVAQPQFSSVALNGNQLVISGTNGTLNGNYYVLASTNVTLPLTSWTPVLTDSFVNGNFSFTNTVDANVKRQFYIIQLP